MATQFNSASLQLLWYYILPQFLVFFLILLVSGGEQQKKKSSDPFRLNLLGRCVAAFVAVSMTFVLLYTSYAFYDTAKQLIETKNEYQEELPLPIKDPADIYSQGPGSLLRFFALNRYDLEDTTAEDVELLQEALIDLLDGNKELHTCFHLPEGFVLREAEPCPDFKTAGSIEEYDRQIIDACQKAMDVTRNDCAYQYHRTGVSALNCLDILSGQCGNDSGLYRAAWDNFMYYGELAVWALTNEYIYGELTDAGKSDLFYRLGQAYDHVGTAATDDDPPFQHELYFISAAFLELSFRSLESINFENRGQEYRSAVWDLYMTMHFRMGKYAKDHLGFFQKVTDCSSKVQGLDQLTERERGDIQGHLNELAEWERYHLT